MNMKKIIYLLSAVLLSVVDTAMAQNSKVREGYYYLLNVIEGEYGNSNYIMHEDGDGHLMYKFNEEIDPAKDLDCVWYIEMSPNGGYTFRNKNTGNYISTSVWGTTSNGFPSFQTQNTPQSLYLSNGYWGRYVIQSEEMLSTGGSICAMHGAIHDEPYGYFQSWWYFVPVVMDGEYYIRNVDADAYLTEGNDWGTQASILPQGRKITVSSAGNGKYTLFTGVYPGGNYREGYGYVTANGWMDGTAADEATYSGGIEFNLKYDDQNRLTITPDGENYFGFDGITSVVSTTSTKDNAGIYWELLSENDYNADQIAKAEFAANYAKLSDAKPYAPVDATFLIKNPNFDEEGGWEGDPTIRVGVGEVWNRTFNVSQTIKNVPNGYYELSYQAFDRANNTTENTNAHDGESDHHAYVVLNGNGYDILPISSERYNIEQLGISVSESGLPYSMEEAAACFNEGLYKNVILVNVEDGEIRLGIQKDEMDGCEWTVFDNFQLKYYGEEMLDITSLIKNPNFDEQGGWEGDPAINNSNGEKWNCTFDVYQNLGNLPAGYYKLDFQGFYRYNNTWDNTNAIAKQKYDESETFDLNHWPIVWFDGIGVWLNSIASEVSNIAKLGIITGENGMPYSQWEAQQCFEAGLYKIETGIMPFGEGEKSIRISKPEQDGCDWTVFDNFHLYYIGDSEIELPGQNPGGGDDKPIYSDIAAYANVIYVEDKEVNKGTEAVLSIKMNNTVGVRGFQCDLVLPAGVTVVMEDGMPAADLSTERTTTTKMNYFDSAIQSDGSLRILCSSTKSYTFDGNSGEVCTVKVNIPEGIEVGDYQVVLKNIIYTDVNAARYTVDDITRKMTVLDYVIGDANGDRSVDVSDAAEIANYILGNASSNFNFKASDINGDGSIDVSDFAGLANIILYGNTSNAARVRVIEKIK